MNKVRTVISKSFHLVGRACWEPTATSYDKCLYKVPQKPRGVGRLHRGGDIELWLEG